MVVAIDGPSGSGKSSTSRGVAQRLGFSYLDTGAMYRAAAWQVAQKGATCPELIAEVVAQARIDVVTDPANEAYWLGPRGEGETGGDGHGARRRGDCGTVREGRHETRLGKFGRVGTAFAVPECMEGCQIDT